MLLEYFQMIDQVAALDANEKRLVARSTIPEESPIFEGHFPGHALMPGVLLIETMAQASGYLVLSLNNFSQMPFLVGVREASSDPLSNRKRRSPSKRVWSMTGLASP